MRIFFSAGEPSGDRHAALLIRELKKLRPNIECVGLGGPQMREAGCSLIYELTTLAVMWIMRVLWNLRTFFRVADMAERDMKEHRPDAVVLIDYPGFNWHIAKRAKRLGIPVYYYCPPQLWAWAEWRLKKMKRTVDHVLCTLPFEEDYYSKHGFPTTLVGHPFFEELAAHKPNRALLAASTEQVCPVVAILPGSRTQELEANLPAFVKAAHLIHGRVPHCRFVVACFNEKHAKRACDILCGTTLPIAVHHGKTHELMQLADCCMATSGSASLELLYYLKPTVIHYGVGKVGFWVQSVFRKVKYITLVNLMATTELHPKDLSLYDRNSPDAENVPFPEYLTAEDKSRAIADHICEWLVEPEAREKTVRRLRELKAQFAHSGASARAADAILQSLRERKTAATSVSDATHGPENPRPRAATAYLTTGTPRSIASSTR
ncbi:MAG TPA: lipid-A-disaccharide synthase [Pirellulales bacterium]